MLKGHLAPGGVCEGRAGLFVRFVSKMGVCTYESVNASMKSRQQAGQVGIYKREKKRARKDRVE